MNNLPILLPLIISIYSNFSYPTTKESTLVEIATDGEFKRHDIDKMLKDITKNLNEDELKKNFYNAVRGNFSVVGCDGFDPFIMHNFDSNKEYSFNANCLTQNIYEQEIYSHNCSPVNVGWYKLFLVVTRTFTKGQYCPIGEDIFDWKIIKREGTFDMEYQENL